METWYQQTALTLLEPETKVLSLASRVTSPSVLLPALLATEMHW